MSLTLKEYDIDCMDSEVKRKFTSIAIGFPSWQGMVRIRRKRPKGPWIIKDGLPR
jgi:hypothetical protein